MIIGKPIERGGIVGRDTATADGAMYVLKALLEDQHRSAEGLTAAIQGAGNAGARAAKVMSEMGMRIVALSDSRGTLAGDNLNVTAICEVKDKQGSVIEAVNFAGNNGRVLAPDAVITEKADILVPAALEDQIHKGNVDNVDTDIIIEVANGPTTPDADDILAKRGIAVVPDVLANAGGVTVSYFEWLQNRSKETWPRARVFERLEGTMQSAYRDVADFALTRGVTLREAAYALALMRILEPAHSPVQSPTHAQQGAQR